jgi:hypothetical protein
MQDIGIKIAIAAAVAIAVVTSIPLLAQEAGASAQTNTAATASSTQGGGSTQAGGSASAGAAGIQADGSTSSSGKVTYVATGGGFGDQAASHAWEMSSISGELQGKLDSKTARSGDRVVLKTIDKVQTSDGTMIPRGALLVGHVTQVQAYSKENGAATIGIAFDQVEMKKGSNRAMYVLIRGVSPAAMTMNAMNGGGMMDPSMDNGAAMGGSGSMGGGSMGGGGTMGAGTMGGGSLGGGRSGGGGVLGSSNGTLNRAGGVPGDTAGGVMDRTTANASTIGDPATTGLGSTANGTVQAAGHGDMNPETNVHAAAAARAIPRPTRIPGVMLSGSSTASGLLLGSRGNISLEIGTEMQLGIVAKD